MVHWANQKFNLLIKKKKKSVLMTLSFCLTVGKRTCNFRTQCKKILWPHLHIEQLITGLWPLVISHTEILGQVEVRNDLEAESFLQKLGWVRGGAYTQTAIKLFSDTRTSPCIPVAFITTFFRGGFVQLCVCLCIHEKPFSTSTFSMFWTKLNHDQ